MPTIRQLKYVIKTVELGSINEAAKQLFISQPSLSNALKNIEEELNITIFQRSGKWVSLTDEGVEFLTYARQVLEQVALLEAKYHSNTKSKKLLSISCQHYAFAVHAFSQLVKTHDHIDEYEFTLRETETYNVFDDVATLRSELGIIFISEFNRKIFQKIFKEKHLNFTPLFQTEAHVFVSKNHPLAHKAQLTLKELEQYPNLSYEQGHAHAFYFAEEVLSTHFHKKTIKVSDRATIFNLMHGVNGYTLSTGILSRHLNDENVVSIPLNIKEIMTIGFLQHKQSHLSQGAIDYLTILKQHIAGYGFDILNKN